MILLVLSVVLFLFGSSQLANLERWAARKAGLKQLPSGKAQSVAALQEPADLMALPERVEDAPVEVVEETVIRRPRPVVEKPQENVPEEVVTRIRASSRRAQEQKSKQQAAERHANLPPAKFISR